MTQDEMVQEAFWERELAFALAKVTTADHALPSPPTIELVVADLHALFDEVLPLTEVC